LQIKAGQKERKDMDKQACVFLADGFEEIEGLTVVDLLRRGRVKVTTVSIQGELTVKGSHNIEVKADALFDQVDYDAYDMVILPGGMPGTKYLGAHEGLEKVLKHFYEKEKYIGAICAAPSVLGKYGILKERRATSYPGFEEVLNCGSYVPEEVVEDDFIITSRGLGTAIPFALALLEKLMGEETAREVQASILYQGK
jgi:4-methyl-5(b-hydroxyethyl)-thiazole monophosphate biosynthesis